MAQLHDRDRSVLILRFGLKDGQRSTLQSIGDQLGVSRERVRQIERRGLSRLLRALRGMAPDVARSQAGAIDDWHPQGVAALFETIFEPPPPAGAPAAPAADPPVSRPHPARPAQQPDSAPGNHRERLERIRSKHRRAYKPWTKDEEAALSRAFQAGETVEQMCHRLGRQPGGVSSRLRRLGLID